MQRFLRWLFVGVHEVKARGPGIPKLVHQNPGVRWAGKPQGGVAVLPFRFTVFDASKYFDDRMAIGYWGYAIGVDRPVMVGSRPWG